MKKMYQTTTIKNKNDFTRKLETPKVRVSMNTCKSASYSYYTKATRKSERKLKNSLKRLDWSNL